MLLCSLLSVNHLINISCCIAYNLHLANFINLRTIVIFKSKNVLATFNLIHIFKLQPDAPGLMMFKARTWNMIKQNVWKFSLLLVHMSNLPFLDRTRFVQSVHLGWGASGLEKKKEKCEFRKTAAPKWNEITQSQNKLGPRLLILLWIGWYFLKCLHFATIILNHLSISVRLGYQWC